MLRTIRSARWIPLAAIACLFPGCGGRANENTYADGDPAPPTCGEICGHVVDACAPGASIDSCAADCGKTVTDYQSCSMKLDQYLRCMGTAKVECRGGEAIIVSCDAERQTLQNCMSP